MTRAPWTASILVDHAQEREAAKRGGGLPKLSLDQTNGLEQQQDQDVIALDEALATLGKLDAQQAQVSNCGFRRLVHPRHLRFTRHGNP